MKFLYFTDSQADDMQPSCRSDIFTNTLFNKFREIGELAKQEKVDRIFCGGDFLDQPCVAHSFLNMLIDILKEYPHPIDLVLGNHDLVGYNLDSVERSAIGLLRKSGVINICDSTQNRQIGPYYFHFIPFNANHKLELYKDLYNLSIAITHNAIIPCEKIPCHIPFEHLHPKDIYSYLVKNNDLPDLLENKNLLILSGHTHGYYNVEYKGVRFANPGSLSRVSREPREFQRDPMVFIVDCTDAIKISEIKLKSAPKWQDILTEKKIKTSDTNLNLTDLREMFFRQKSQISNISDLIKSVGKEKEIPDTIISESLRRIEQHGKNV